MGVQDKLMNDLNDIENKIVSIKKDAVQFKTDIGEISQKNKIDGITGLNNRMSFESRYEKDIRKLGKENFSGMSVILADIDAFVRINQKYGDFVGDKILRVLGLTLRKTLNEKDFVARIGSDFFGIITYTREPDAAKAVSEKIISAIKSIPFHYKNEKVPVTISAAYKVITDDEPADAVLSSLSETLEKAKNSESAARSSSDEPFARGLLLEC
jgi:diguanylate cyclase (GGDEF)-like protein